MDFDVTDLECSDLGRLGADPLLSTNAENVVESSAAMNNSNEISGWDNLGTDLQLSILSVLRQQADKDSLQAVLQASHMMQLLASSLIHAAVVCDAEVLISRFPRHATLTSMQLVMEPPGNKPADPCIEMAVVISWMELNYASGISNSLRCVTDVKVELPYDAGGQQDKALVVAAIEALSHACPGLRSFCVNNLDRYNEALMIAFFIALGQHLPRLTELEIRVETTDSFDFEIAGIDWAACLPPALRKITLPFIDVDRSLMQHLVQMPKLVEVAAYSFCVLLQKEDGESIFKLDPDLCSWQLLKLAILPSFNAVSQFTAWPRVLIECIPSFEPFSNWQLGPPCPAQTAAVATAAERLSTCTYTPLALGDFFVISWEKRPKDPASAAGIILALAPLAGLIPKLLLKNWPINAALLDEVAQALPHTSNIAFELGCSLTSDAWVRLLTLTSVTEISFLLMGETIQLADFVSFMTAVPRAMHVGLAHGCLPILDFCSPLLSASDLEAWDRFEPLLAQRRIALGLPALTITDNRVRGGV